MSEADIFDSAARMKKYNRSYSSFYNYSYLFTKSAESISDRLLCLKNHPKKILIFAERGNTFSDAIKSIFAEAEITSTENTEISIYTGSDFDCIISSLYLHKENNIRDFIRNAKNALKPGGVFISSFFGENTLAVLRKCMIETEMHLYGKVSPRVHPSISIKSAGALLQYAGFILPAADCETYTVVHNDVIGLIHDLRGMGETNILSSRSRIPLSRNFFEILKEKYAVACGNSDGTVETGFDIIYIIGWKE